MEDATPQGLPAGGPQTGHEDTNIAARPLFISAGVLVATVIVCQVVLALWMKGFESGEQQARALHPDRKEIPVQDFPNPRLQESPPVELGQVMQEERTRISSYGWVDQKAGIARIPVDRAMQILTEKGLPRVAAPPPTPGAPPNTSIPPAGKRDGAGDRPETKPGGKP